MVDKRFNWILGIIGGFIAGFVLGCIFAATTSGNVLDTGFLGAIIFGIPVGCITSCILEREPEDKKQSRPL
ncbi:MAG: hypothetical protein RBG13Loki_2688 [Promethearchaeota archaeon CR_4]|nr:MAG: hypothetical protein RBG13Loki_2688 [Candidatus Lokiarchaeota archaeon CR_4]